MNAPQPNALPRFAIIACVVLAFDVTLMLAVEIDGYVIAGAGTLCAAYFEWVHRARLFEGIGRGDWAGLLRASAIATAFVSAYAAAFMPVTLPLAGWPLGSLFGLCLCSAASVIFAARLARRRPRVTRAILAFAFAVTVVALEIATSQSRPSLAQWTSAAPRGSVSGAASGSTAEVGVPGDWVTIQRPTPISDVDWGAWHSHVDRPLPRALLVSQTQKPGRFVVDVLMNGNPDRWLGFHPPERFIADRRCGHLPFAFAWLGRRASMPWALVAWAVAWCAVAWIVFIVPTVVRAAKKVGRRRERATPAVVEGYREALPHDTPAAGDQVEDGFDFASAIAWIGAAPLAVWRILATLLS